MCECTCEWAELKLHNHISWLFIIFNSTTTLLLSPIWTSVLTLSSIYSINRLFLKVQRSPNKGLAIRLSGPGPSECTVGTRQSLYSADADLLFQGLHSSLSPPSASRHSWTRQAGKSTGEGWGGGGEARSTAEWPGSGPIVFRVTSLFLSEPPEVCFLPSGCGSAIKKSLSGRGQYLVWFPPGEGREGGDPSLNQQSRGVAHGRPPEYALAEIKPCWINTKH